MYTDIYNQVLMVQNENLYTYKQAKNLHCKNGIFNNTERYKILTKNTTQVVDCLVWGVVLKFGLLVLLGLKNNKLK